MQLTPLDQQILCQFFSRKPVKRAFLFGSYARNEASVGSDIDLLLELDYSGHIGISFFSFKDELQALLHKQVDIVTDDGLSRYIKPFVEKDKILIYEKALDG